MSDNPYAQFAQPEASSSENPYAKFAKPKAGVKTAPSAPYRGEPILDVPGDIIKEGTGSLGALGRDVGDTIRPTDQSKNPGLFSKITHGMEAVDEGVESAENSIYDLGALAMSPVTGAVHGTVGSSLGHLPGMDKEKGDLATDVGMMLAPGLPKALNLGKSALGIPVEESLSLSAEENSANKAKNAALSRIESRAKSAGMTAQDIMDRIQQGRSVGADLRPMDVDPQLASLAKKAYKGGGEASSILDKTFEERLSNASPELKRQLESVANGSTFRTANELITQRSRESKPLFAKAFDTGSTAPFEKQIEDNFNYSITREKDAQAALQKAQQDITLLEAKNKTTSNVYASPTPKELKDARLREFEAREEVNAAQTDKKAVLDKLRTSQTDRETNAPGAVWSPGIERVLSRPDVRKGIVKGMNIEGNLAVGEQRKALLTDPAIKGFESDGTPIIEGTPTMRTLAVAKEGLDAQIAEAVHPNGMPTKEGYALRKLRDYYVSELRRVNPAYGEAIDAWSGHSASLDALNMGKVHFNRPESDEELQTEFAKLSDTDKELYKLGAVESKVDTLNKVSHGGNAAKAVNANPKDVNRFNMLFDSHEDATKFLQSVDYQRLMHENAKQIGGGLPGDPEASDRRAKKDIMTDAAFGMFHAAHSNPLALRNVWNLANELKMMKNQDLNAEIAKYLSSPGFEGFEKAPTESTLSRILKGPQQ